MAINTRKYVEANLVIKTKESKLAKLKFNEPQEMIYAAIKKQAEQKKPIRLIILKARQQGASTLIGGITFKRTATNFNVNSAVVAHDSESTSKLFTMYKLFYEKLPQELKPMLKANNAQVLEFDRVDGNGLKSNIRCMTAGSSGVGRGSTIHNLHLSEFAFWSGDKLETYAGLIQAVPNTLNTMVVIESTANGFNEFQELWQMAERGENDFEPVFIPWFALREYRLKTMPLTYDSNELVLKERFNLDDEQLAWRRWCIKNNCGGDLNKFRQEYPSTPQEAFVSTGECYFNVEDIITRMAQIKQPLSKGYFAYEKEFTSYGEVKLNNVRFVEDSQGFIEIYKQPTKTSYSLGGDTAGDGSDSSVAQVIDNNTLEQVAKLSKEKITEDEYAEQVVCLARYYNEALVGIETNFNAYVVQLISKLGYTKQYLRESGADEVYTKYKRTYGFKTTSATRTPMLTELKIIFKESPQVVNSGKTLDEMRTFIVGNGRGEAMQGKHDDEVMALAIAYAIRHQSDLGNGTAKFSSIRI